MSAQNAIDRPWTQLSIDIATTTTVLVSPSATQQYLIYAINLQSAAAGTIIFKHGTTAFEGARTMATGVPLDLDMFPDMRPRFICALGESFVITLSASAQTSGSIWYTLGPI